MSRSMFPLVARVLAGSALLVSVSCASQTATSSAPTAVATLPSASASTGAAATSAPTTVAASLPPTAAPTSFSPGVVSLTFDGHVATVADTGELQESSLADGIAMTVGIVPGGTLADGYYQIDLSLGSLKKAPTASDFAASDVGAKTLEIESVVSGSHSRYVVADPNGLTLFASAGKLDVSYSGTLNKVDGPTTDKASVLAVITLKGVPLSH